jgi:uncharacterized membrane protein HdeD (DUF308 family)
VSTRHPVTHTQDDVSKEEPAGRRHSIGFWVTLFRGILAVVLGVALILHPDKARPILVNFMGMFWLASGVMSLRWGGLGLRARRLSTAAGVVGILAGIMVLSRHLTRGIVGETQAISLLGGVMVLTGIIHAAGGFRTEEDGRRWSWTGLILGIFEIVLGALLLTSPLDLGPLTYFAAAVWAFVGAFMLLGDAMRQRARLTE